MSASVRAPVDDRNIELGSAVNWRPILAAAGLGVVVLLAVVVLALTAPATPKTEPVVAQTTVVPAPDQDTFLPPPLPQPRVQPQPTVVVALAKPAWPDKPKMISKRAIWVSTPVPPPVVEATPEPARSVQVAQKTPVQTFKRYSPYEEADLRERLDKEAREVDVEAKKGTTKKLLAESSKATKSPSTDKSQAKTRPILEVIAKRDDLKGLPLRDMDKCQVPATEAKIMAKMSVTVRSATPKVKFKRDKTSTYPIEWEYDRVVPDYVKTNLKGAEWREDVGARMLVQMFQSENEASRLEMVKKLTEVKGKRGSTALAQRAVFDLSSEVRQAALTALKKRPLAEVRPVLLEAMRYPWAPVADHAAEALVALNDQDAVVDLVSLLDKPDPQAPFQNKEKKWVARQLVRVNHLSNCVLCHAPCSATEKTVRGLVPERGKPLPVEYYASRRGDFVRADVTYLKQDFSITHLVAKPDNWPAMQRFDYLIRQRVLSAEEVKRWTQAEKSRTNDSAYPQHEAILWALCELTGASFGPHSKDWDPYVLYMTMERVKCDP